MSSNFDPSFECFLNDESAFDPTMSYTFDQSFEPLLNDEFAFDPSMPDAFDQSFEHSLNNGSDFKLPSTSASAPFFAPEGDFGFNYGSGDGTYSGYLETASWPAEYQTEDATPGGLDQGNFAGVQQTSDQGAVVDCVDPALLDARTTLGLQPGEPIPVSIQLFTTSPGNEHNWSMSRCRWAGCSTTSNTREEAKLHVDSHLKILSDNWPGPVRCQWSRCTSKVLFRTFAPLKHHIDNIHVAPVLCTVPGCTYKRPFGRRTELERHLRTKHDLSERHFCPVEDCEAHVNGFLRRDKLLKHASEKHPLLRCPYNHCSAAVCVGEEERHVQKCHGEFECAIGSCDGSRKSCFPHYVDAGLRGHLEKCHSFNWMQAVERLKLAEKSDKVARSLPGEDWPDCPTCSAH